MSVIKTFNTVICICSYLLAASASATPFHNITYLAGGGPPDSEVSTPVSKYALKEFQLALFLENLEADYFQTGLRNLTVWGIGGHPNSTIDVVGKIAAVSRVK